MDEYISVSRAAALTGYCSETIRQAILRKELPASKPAGAPNRPWRIKLSDLFAWANGGTPVSEEQREVPSSKDLLSALLDESPEMTTAPLKRPPF